MAKIEKDLSDELARQERRQKAYAAISVAGGTISLGSSLIAATQALGQNAPGLSRATDKNGVEEYLRGLIEQGDESIRSIQSLKTTTTNEASRAKYDLYTILVESRYPVFGVPEMKKP